MVPRQAYPPTHSHPHLTKRLTPAEAQQQLALFLAKTERKAYLHPDAQLSAAGINFAAQSGTKGGLAIHHLRRIEAGLRGESLVAETAEELEAEFGAPAGDDSRVDALIEGGVKRKRSEEDVDKWLEEESSAKQPEGGKDEGWQDKEEYEHSQREIKGEVGDRAGAPVVKQNGVPPAIKHVDDKKAKRDAKKAKKKVEKVERAQVKREKADEG